MAEFKFTIPLSDLASDHQIRRGTRAKAHDHAARLLVAHFSDHIDIVVTVPDPAPQVQYLSAGGVPMSRRTAQMLRVREIRADRAEAAATENRRAEMSEMIAADKVRRDARAVGGSLPKSAPRPEARPPSFVAPRRSGVPLVLLGAAGLIAGMIAAMAVLS